MTQLTETRPTELRAYTEYTREQWRAFRKDTPMPLSSAEIAKLSGFGEDAGAVEVEDIYLPLVRLLRLRIEARKALWAANAEFFGEPQTSDRPIPFVIGVGGAMVAGKSTTTRLLQALLAGGEDPLKVDVVGTDSFLYSNAELESRNLAHRKGYPDSYNQPALMRFAIAVKSGVKDVVAPVYSHAAYDVVPAAKQVISQPDVLILQGVNVLRTGPRAVLSDLFDFSIYVDASLEDLERWYIARFVAFRSTEFTDPAS